MADDYDLGKVEARFNMGIDTLMRLGRILEHIKNLPFMIIDLGIRQQKKLDLLKDFFIQMSPLMPEEADEYKDKVLKLRVSKIDKYTDDGIFIRRIILFDEKLEYEMNCLLIDLQVRMQNKKKMFMPEDNDGDDSYE